MKMLFLFLIIIFLSSCCKEETISEKNYWHEARTCKSDVSKTSCGLYYYMPIDTGNDGFTDIFYYPEYLQDEYKDTSSLVCLEVYVKYELLGDTFLCQQFGGVINGNGIIKYQKIRIIDIKWK